MNLHRSEHWCAVFDTIADAPDQILSGHRKKENVFGARPAAASVEFVEGIHELADFAAFSDFNFNVRHPRHPIEGYAGIQKTQDKIRRIFPLLSSRVASAEVSLRTQIRLPTRQGSNSTSVFSSTSSQSDSSLVRENVGHDTGFS
jgi:hypothetical protein